MLLGALLGKPRQPWLWQVVEALSPSCLGAWMLGLPTAALQAPSSNQALEVLMARESLRPERPRVGRGHRHGGGKMAENIALFANYV